MNNILLKINEYKGTSIPLNGVCQRNTHGITALDQNASDVAVSCMPRRTLEVHKGTAKAASSANHTRKP